MTAPGASEALESATDPDPAIAVAVPPVQLLLKLFGVATTSPEGNVSVNAIPFSVELLLGLLTWNERLVVPLSGIDVAPKVLVIDGGSMTVNVAEDVLPFPASVESMVTLFE
jgi:hypothetical protein